MLQVKGGRRYELRGGRTVPEEAEAAAANSGLELDQDSLHQPFVGFANAYRVWFFPTPSMPPSCTQYRYL